MKLSEWLSKERGRGVALAKAIGVSPVLISQWATGPRVPPYERCIPIERETYGAVTRCDLRPQDYLEMWPELAHVQPAPPPEAINADAPLTTDPELDAALSQAAPAGLVHLPKKALAWDGVEHRHALEQRRAVDRERDGLPAAGKGAD